MADAAARIRTLSNSAAPRVLIVDDSAVARAVIARAVEHGRRFVVAEAVANAETALAFLARSRVDAIVLDIEMPGISGLAALPDLIAASRGAKVLVVSSSCGQGAVASIEALALGAADTLVKPGMSDLAGAFSVAIGAKLARLLAVEPAHEPLADEWATPLAVGDGYDIVAIGASTGGIHALNLMLRELPASFQLPILITQHLPASFMPYFADQIALLAGRPCEIAVDRLRICPGRVIVAPGDAHMRIVSTGVGASIRLSEEKSKTGCVPSVDPMLESMAEVYGPRALAVVLSGMGRDGAEGARRVAERGGCVMVQDRTSSVVWGMPGAVANGSIPHTELTPREIGRFVAARRRPA